MIIKYDINMIIIILILNNDIMSDNMMVLRKEIAKSSKLPS